MNSMILQNWDQSKQMQIHVKANKCKQIHVKANKCKQIRG